MDTLVPCALFRGVETGVLGILSRGTKASVPVGKKINYELNHEMCERKLRGCGG